MRTTALQPDSGMPRPEAAPAYGRRRDEMFVRDERLMPLRHAGSPPSAPLLRAVIIRWAWSVCILASLLMGGNPAEAEVQSFTAEEYAFTGPEQMEAGWQTVDLINRGRDVHQIQFLGLPAGKTAEDVRQALAGRMPSLPGWLRRHGGVNSVAPGNQASVVINLDPGTYVLLCGIPDATGRPHAMRGMVRPLRVVEAGSPAAPATSGDTTVSLKDFFFSLNKPLTTGARILHVKNDGKQAHELVLIRLAQGASTQDFIADYRPGGAANPAGMEAGGVTGIDPGREAYVHLNVEPGRYGLMCFLADPVTGIPHFTRGMVMDLDVRPREASSEGS